MSSPLLSKFTAVIKAPLPTKKVKIKYGEEIIEVEVRALNGTMQKAYRAQLKDKKDEMDALLIVNSVFDPETGVPVFGPEHVEMIESAPYVFAGIRAAINSLNWADMGNDG